MKEIFPIFVGIVIGGFVLYGLVRMVILPFDFYKYFKSPFCQGLHVKYRQGITKRPEYKLYCAMVNDKLPMTYGYHGNKDYFLWNGQVLLFWRAPMYRLFEKDGAWFFQVHFKDDGVTDIGAHLAKDLAVLPEECRNLPAKYLIFAKELADTGNAELVSQCPYILCIDDPKELDR